ncbi:MAG TPA: hypothetical protein VKQ32_03850 [Polyangia bacterium]|nr:hypothetical protein [Polyangia bacterium]
MLKKVRTFLFWLFAPVLVIGLAAPLVLGHVVIRLMIAQMRRRPRALPQAKPEATAAVRTTPTCLRAI